MPQLRLLLPEGLFITAALHPQPGAPCAPQPPDDLVRLITEWTTWGAWLIGGLGVLWVVAGFYPALTYTRNSMDYYKGAVTVRMALARVVEAALLFFIAWRVGAIGQFVENVMKVHCTDSHPVLTTTTPATLGPPIAALLGYTIALVIQCFLLYLVPRIAFHAVDLVYGIMSNTIGLPPGAFQRAALAILLESILLGVGIVFAPNLVTWLLTALT